MIASKNNAKITKKGPIKTCLSQKVVYQGVRSTTPYLDLPADRNE